MTATNESESKHFLSRIPAYLWSLLALFIGIALGGTFSGPLGPVANFTEWIINAIVTVVPLIILAALSPAIAMLIKRGLAGKFAGCVVAWYVLTSAVAGLVGVVVSSIAFRIPFTTGTAGAWAEAANMIAAFGEQSGASMPLMAIAGAVITGVWAAVWSPPLYAFLGWVERAITWLGHGIAYVLPPLILCFGILLGTELGTKSGISHSISLTLYTAAFCFAWWTAYLLLIRAVAGKGIAGRLVSDYLLPTGIFAAGTSSSLATLPINIARIKKCGVRGEVADFIVPLGAVVNMDGSAMTFIAAAPFVVGHVYGYEISWTMMLVAWPALVLFTIAAPGLPGGVGTALWSGTLFAGMLGLEGPEKTTFIGTWVALTNGLPDTIRTSANATCDGLMAALFDRFYEKLKPGEPSESGDALKLV